MAVPAAPAVPGVPPAPACAPGDEFELHFIGELESPCWHLVCFSLMVCCPGVQPFLEFDRREGTSGAGSHCE